MGDFRQRGINVAFATIGNRVDKTMRKAKLTSFIGEKWLFANVNDAVQFCLKHQHAKKTRAAGQVTIGPTGSGLSNIDIGSSNEIGISNEIHSEHTMVFITLIHDWPTVVSDITGVFKKNK